MLGQYFALLACLAGLGVGNRYSPLVPRQECAAGYEECNADGSDGSKPPGVGDDGLRDLYADVINSVNAAGATVTKRDLTLQSRADDGPALCCKADAGLDCLLLQGLRISFCWDRFRTNYQFADGSWGSLITGAYHTAGGDDINLVAGNYTLSDGKTGNIYASNEGEKPNTRTLDVPTPWTSSGVGPAIPGSELGGQPTALPPTATGAGQDSAGSNNGNDKATITVTGTATGTETNAAGSLSPVREGLVGIVACWVGFAALAAVGGMQLVH